MSEREQPTQSAIEVKGVTKEFRIPHEKIDTMRGFFINLFKRKTYEEFKALNDISFTVNKGEFFGIIGRNGSGKSTLLKVIAGIYSADNGSVHVNGRISPFLELGIGFNPELSGRDNIYLNATVLGLSKKQIDQKFKSIIQFSELERFIDQKLKNYSSGMQVRLAFSVAIHANRDILLMDEVLAVGDSNFQQKCIEEFQKYRDQGKTVILVSHDITVIQRYCDRAMLLRNGAVIVVGKTDEVVSEYMYQNIADEERRLIQEEKKRNGSTAAVEQNATKRIAEITDVKFFDAKGRERHIFGTGDTIVTRIFYKTRKRIERPVFGVAIHTDQGVHIAGPNTKTSGFTIPYIEGEGSIDFVVQKNPFFTNLYLFTVALFEWECVIPYDFQDKRYRFRVLSEEANQHGAVKIPVVWQATQHRNAR